MADLMRVVTLYTRSGCGLCDDVQQQLAALQRRHAFALREVDIDREPELRERYTDHVPVVAIDGHEACRHRLDTEAFLRLLHGKGGG